MCKLLDSYTYICSSKLTLIKELLFVIVKLFELSTPICMNEDDLCDIGFY